MSLQRGSDFFSVPAIIPLGFLIFSILLFFFVTAMYIGKIIKYPKTVREEFYSPTTISFFPTFSISILLLSTALLPINATFSKYLWFLGALLQCTFTIIIVNIWMHHDNFEITQMNPSWFIPAVGNILIPIAGVIHAPKDISWFFFSCGFFFWMILMGISSIESFFVPQSLKDYFQLFLFL